MLNNIFISADLLARIAMTRFYLILLSYFSVTVIFILTSFLSFNVEAKPRCKSLLLKLHNIQALQRKGYTLKQGQALIRKENKARGKWWQCEQNISPPQTNKKRPKKNKKSSKNKYKSHIGKASLYNVRLKSFNQHRAIVIKAKYQGDKRKAWQRFYEKPAQCQQPKTLQVFAYCSDNKLQQQAIFERDFIR